MHEFSLSIKLSIGRTGGSLASLLLAGVASLALSGPAHATLTIDPTFDSSITSQAGAAQIEGAVVGEIELYALGHRDRRMAFNFGQQHRTGRPSSSPQTSLGYDESNAEKGQSAKRQ